MKIKTILHFLLIAICFITSATYGQTIAKFYVAAQTKVNPKPVLQKMQNIKDTIYSINADIHSVSKESTLKNVIAVSNRLNHSFLVTIMPQAAKIAADLDSMQNGKKKITSVIDTLNPKDIDSSNIAIANTTTNTDEDTGCPNLAKVSQMIEEKQDDGSYLFSLVNKKGNSLSTFVLYQLDETLFSKKVEQAVYGLCNEALADNDSTKAKAIIGAIKTENLYQRFLEASLTVDNSQDEAGSMRIFKKVKVYVVKNNSVKKPNIDSSNIKDKTKSATAINILSQTAKDTYNLDAENILSASFVSKAAFARGTSNWVGEISGNSPLYAAGPPDTSGTITGQPKVKMKAPSINDSIGMFTVHKIQIQFQDGFIENIKVEGTMDGNDRLLRFENFYPIAFSTKQNYKRLYQIRLFEKTIFQDSNYFLNLGEILYYSENLALESKDYSPANQTYKNKAITDSITEVTLYKDQTSKILEVKAYSDLKGVNSANPNGLIQFELSKKLNFWTLRTAFGNSEGRNINWGFFNYIVPSLSINKIENNEKRLVVNSINNAFPHNNPNIPLTYASTIDVFSHQNFTLGFDLSAVLVDDQSIKSTFNFGPFFYYGNVPLQDTLREKKINTDDNTFTFQAKADNNVNNYDINTFYWGAFANWQIFPNPKYGVTITGRIMDFKALTRNFLQVRDSLNYETFIKAQNGDDTKYDNYSYHKTLISTEIFGFFKPSENNKLFFRFRITKDLNEAKNPYRQIQIGYATFLTKTKEIKEKKSENTATNNNP